MAKHSKEILDDVAANNAIIAIDDTKELQAFIKGEQRESLLDLAAFRMNHLKTASHAKQGEQAGPITQQTADFKGGVQGTKGADGVTGSTPNSTVTGQDIIEGLDEAAEKKAKEAAVKSASSADSETKSESELRRERGVVTGEDVLKNMRAEGKKV